MDMPNKPNKRKLTPLFVKGPSQASQESNEWLDDEFPTRKGLVDLGRRDMLKMVGGALALAGLSATGCRYQPQRKIVPFVDHVEGSNAGSRKKYASMTTIGGFAVGVLVDQVDGRPIRVDGHPHHPASLGSLSSRLTAEILNLYDPDRLTMPEYNGDPSSWRNAFKSIREKLEKSKSGGRIAFLSETVGSPTLAKQIDAFLKKYPQSNWYQYESVNRDSIREGATMAFGQNASVRYDFTKADVLVALDSDLLHEGPAAIRYSRDVASRRRSAADGSGMSRIYAFESHPMTLGLISDHRVRIKPSEILALALALATKIGVPGSGSSVLPKSVDSKLFESMASDLMNTRGKSVIVPGDHSSREVHAVCHAINNHLNNMGSTVIVDQPVLPRPSSQSGDLQQFVTQLQGGQLDMVVMLGGNPVYSVPGDIDLAELLSSVPLTVYMGGHRDETAKATQWQLPVSHFLEAWGDGVAYDGTYSVCQPIIEPIYDSKSYIQLMDQLLGGSGDAEALVKKTASAGGQSWDETLSAGIAPLPRPASVPLTVNPGVLGAIATNPATTGMELLILPDPTIYDGRYSNNNWLQETPKPITNLTWDNALLMSHGTATKLGVVAPFDKKTVANIPFYGAADMVRVTVGGQSLELPVWVNYGQADDVLVLHLGYGHEVGGQFAKKRIAGPMLSEVPAGGFDAHSLRTMANPVWVGGVQVEKIKGEYVLASTQFHNTIDVSDADKDRHLIHEITAAELAAKAAAGHEGEHEEHHAVGPAEVHNRNYGEHGGADDMSFYTGKDFEDSKAENYQWAMTIDLSLCTGCNACVTACQAENNIPTVDKDQVMDGREMHWIRVDRYYKGNGDSLDKDNPPIYVQPVTCMQCEQAPCEPVCPVAATVHSTEGINQMVYNRCVGTRYCSNNCPYKVRRFNFFHYSQRADQIPVLKMLQNPDVTVRFRGVMEKCTYCVQRINHARIDAKRESRLIKDGEVRTACQTACPTEAIIFGDKRDPANAISKSRADQRNYVMLEELNTRPRTTYLSKVTNPNPELKA